MIVEKSKDTGNKDWGNKRKNSILFLCIGLLVGAILAACICMIRQNSIIDKKNAQIQNLKNRTTELESDLSDTKDKYEKLEKDHDQLEAEYTEYQKEMESLHKEGMLSNRSVQTCDTPYFYLSFAFG